MAKRNDKKGQVYQFPLPLDDSAQASVSGAAESPRGYVHPRNQSGLQTVEVAISGTYRKDNKGLLRDYEELKDLGCRILSPTSAHVILETDGFVFMEGESGESPEKIELRHLGAIQEAQFVWLHAPDGYVGLSAALEVGFAHAVGIPIYSRANVTDPILATFVDRVPSPRTVIETSLASNSTVPAPAVQAFQKYYKRAAIQRGYANESAQDTLLLMVEEVGELARAIRKKEKLTRHGKGIQENEALELADVFIYVVHLANVLGVSLSEVVRQKELINIEKMFRSRAAR